MVKDYTHTERERERERERQRERERETEKEDNTKFNPERELHPNLSFSEHFTF